MNSDMPKPSITEQQYHDAEGFGVLSIGEAMPCLCMCVEQGTKPNILFVDTCNAWSSVKTCCHTYKWPNTASKIWLSTDLTMKMSQVYAISFFISDPEALYSVWCASLNIIYRRRKGGKEWGKWNISFLYHLVLLNMLKGKRDGKSTAEQGQVWAVRQSFMWAMIQTLLDAVSSMYSWSALTRREIQSPLRLFMTKHT